MKKKKSKMSYNSPGTMSDAAARKLSLERYGDNATIGCNPQHPDAPFRVEVTGRYGRKRFRGTGRSWEECFSSMREWPDGAPPAYEK